MELKWSEPKETAKKVKAVIILGVFPNYFILLKIQKPLISIVAISEKKKNKQQNGNSLCWPLLKQCIRTVSLIYIQ